MGEFSFERVLLIDDSEIDVLVNRRLIELTRFARQVDVAVSGEDALDMLKSSERKPDWIFLDMHLPGMNGLEFLERLSAESAETYRIILLSVMTRPDDLRKVLSVPGVAGQLDKPLTQQALRDLAANGRVLSPASF
jgi:CheY-like chemotaxis protein